MVKGSRRVCRSVFLGGFAASGAAWFRQIDTLVPSCKVSVEVAWEESSHKQATACLRMSLLKNQSRTPKDLASSACLITLKC